MVHSFTHTCAGGETVDALALGASGVTHGGSSPLPRTDEQREEGAGRKQWVLLS
jgi:hypothetical protein